MTQANATPAGPDPGPLPLSNVLRDEFAAIWGPRPEIRALDAKLGALTAGRETLVEACAKARQAGDARAAAAAEEALAGFDAEHEPGRRSAVYAAAHRLKPEALALSGGGIRSASFSLGVLQALAQSGLLTRFHYLSTVSGGGYIGSWLSAWLSRAGRSQDVIDDLHVRRAGGDAEPEEIRHLRDYSAYLTPKAGLVSIDLWTAVAIFIRNLLLNWLVLLPVLAAPVILIKVVAAVAHTGTFGASCPAWGFLVALLGVLLTAQSFGYKVYKLHHPPATQTPMSAGHAGPWNEQTRFLFGCLMPAILASSCFAWLANRWMTAGDALAAGLVDGTFGQTAAFDGWLLLRMVAVAVVVWLLGIVGARLKAGKAIELDRMVWMSWLIAAVVSGVLLWLGVHLYAGLEQKPADIPGVDLLLDKDKDSAINPQILLVILGQPWFLMSMLLGQMTYVMVNGYARNGDFEREWLGRSGGWYLIAALGWILLSSIVLLGSWLYQGTAPVISANVSLATIGAAAGTLTAFLGAGSATSGKGPATDRKAWWVNLALAVAGPLFAAILLIFLSMTFDRLALGTPFHTAAFFTGTVASGEYFDNWLWTFVIAGILLVMALATQWMVNVNRFSLHALYRNRLVRAFLGGSRPKERAPDGFTGFDSRDSGIRVADLWPEGGLKPGSWRPLHVIGIALNLASSRKLAWQQRKAESFTVTPFHCGTAELGYRRTADYGARDGKGITLGTAMAISGAAVSPNMGYHSSPTVAFLLTLFNVRLGWWLGNPGWAGNAGVRPLAPQVDPYRRESPLLAYRPLLSELFGLSDETSSYVHLSDGGHFENLGLYEMVRRRCRRIVVVDAGEDGKRAFEDLGNAVRKIRIDLGVRIAFADTKMLTAAADAEDVPAYAIGTIEYPDGQSVGSILYIKPLVKGSERAADLVAYNRAHEEFPNQSTADQWFDEPQLESYRALGYHIMLDIAQKAATAPALKTFFD